jgi:hypothetical protein
MMFAVRPASATAAAAPTTASSAGVATFVRRSRGTIFGILCVDKLNFHRLCAP